MSEKSWKIIKRVLIVASVLATIKLILFDYTMDEEYQIVMAYRNLYGDSLFKEMWEPHQTSAFMCIGLMGIYHLITGTYTGVIIFLRVCTAFIQVALAVYLYKVLCKLMRKEYAFLLGIAYFNFVPKNIQIPEFSNMQVWFYTIMVLSLMQYYWGVQQEQKRKWYLLVVSGLAMALEVLSYPSCLILFPFFVVYIWVVSKEYRWKDCAIYIGTCGASAVLWLLWILRNLSLDEFLCNLQYVLNFDLTHEISGATEGKGSGLVSNLFWGAILLAGILMVSLVIFQVCKKKWQDVDKTGQKQIFCTIAICVAEAIQLFCWVVLEKGFEFTHMHVVVIFLAAWLLWQDCDDKRRFLWAGIVGGVLSIVAVVYISDLQLYNGLPHGVLGIVLAVAALVLALEKGLGAHAKKWIYILLLGFCVTTLVGKGYTFRAGREFASVFDTGGVMKSGPAAGIFTDYMFAYIYNSNSEDFAEYIEEGDKVLIVTNMVTSAGTTPYMFGDYEICHYSIVDPTAYDERLLTYWELYPEKMPNVIVVDCWYGNLMEDTDNWIMQYIETEFGYTQVDDGSYVRFYRK